jgi:hypothetical protein
MNDNELRAAIVQWLTAQGLDDVSEFLADVLFKYCLSWAVPSANTSEIDGIVAFAFGNRVDDLANRSPGPINKLLADKLVHYYSRCPRKVWAQWEIARLVDARIPSTDLTIIYPIHDRATDSVEFLSTKGVLKQVEKQLPKGKTVLVIAHRDHLWRCVHFTEQFGYRVVAAQDDMPSDYDPESGQLWTTSRDRYVLNDIISRLRTFRDERNEKDLM